MDPQRQYNYGTLAIQFSSSYCYWDSFPTPSLILEQFSYCLTATETVFNLNWMIVYSLQFTGNYLHCSLVANSVLSILYWSR